MLGILYHISHSIQLCYRIDQHGVIKVADFGLTEDMYLRNYFRRDKSEGGSEEKVPIRWMAPESIENNIYNERTDVVSVFIIISHLIIYIMYCSVTVFVLTVIKPVQNVKCMNTLTRFMYNFLIVGIWSDLLGGIHMWRSPLCWCSCHVSVESTPQWPQTGQTQQCHLL